MGGLSVDPWGLLRGGRCHGGQALAYATVCVTEEEHFLANCLASICALLATTDPDCVVAIVSRWVYRAARDLLLLNGASRGDCNVNVDGCVSSVRHPPAPYCSLSCTSS
ncbi:unnamed protein product [Prorocentrum cordatum]|uniref:Uncharacterized protein n=1 Tax=Prorocentrum cordatum TaxID=2364126 RepID=A0ABN9WD42_9DINO|nr:unnamed protein product [Polarella glacialis]